NITKLIISKFLFTVLRTNDLYSGFYYDYYYYYSCVLFLIISLEAPLSFSINTQVHGFWFFNLGFALLKFRVRMNSDPHGTLSNWNVSGSDLCSWSRVTCVEGILISGCSLEGMLAPELRELSELRSLILFGSHFSGEIPKEYGSFGKLKSWISGFERQ
ncbi:unnamed protein product, partial [Brassica oleracea]